MKQSSGSGVSVGSVCRVALRPRGQVAPLRVLLLALRIAPTSVVRRPAGVALRRVVHPYSAGVHHAPVSHRVSTANVTVHTEMIEARPRPRASPRGVHGWGGRRWMDVMKRRDERPETGRSLPLHTVLRVALSA